MSKKTYVIDGNCFSTLEQFYDEISRVVIPGVDWGRNLNAFEDILWGAFGTPEEGFIIVWKNSEVSKQKLGLQETIRQLENMAAKCYPSNVPAVLKQIEDAKQGRGTTVFDWLVEIIREGNVQRCAPIELRLE